MAETMIRGLPWLAGLLLGVFAWPSATLAHRLDEYLQATLVIIDPGEVRLVINLTPGVAVAQKVLPLMDRNRDGAVSTNEATAYAKLLMRDITVELDRRKNTDLKLTSTEFPVLSELDAGRGVIQITFSAIISPLAAGAHTLRVQNGHLRSSSVYLFNAAQPTSGSVHIIRQKRNHSQSTGEIEFSID